MVSCSIQLSSKWSSLLIELHVFLSNYGYDVAYNATDDYLNYPSFDICVVEIPSIEYLDFLKLVEKLNDKVKIFFLPQNISKDWVSNVNYQGVIDMLWKFDEMKTIFELSVLEKSLSNEMSKKVTCEILNCDYLYQIKDGVMIQSLDGCILKVNQVAEKILSIREEDVINCHLDSILLNFMHEDGSLIQKKNLPMNIALSTGKNFIEKIIGIRELDHINWYRLHTLLVKLEESKMSVLISQFTDITDYIIKDEMTKFYKSSFENSPVSIVITNKDAKIIAVNPKFSQVSGYKKSELIGKNPNVLKHPNSKTDYKKLWKTITAGKIWRGEFTNIDASGNLLNEAAVIAPMKNEINEISHYIGIKEDITELSLIKLKLEHSLEESEHLVEKTANALKSAQSNMLESLAILAEYRDNETGQHISRTKYYMKFMVGKIAKDYGYCDEEIQQMWTSAPLHDIGKVAISDSILLKRGKLTVEEFNIMKEHVKFGYQALVSSEKNGSDSSYLKFAKEITLRHHERWDGTGYPDGLKGEKIPISARVMAISDVYDALRSKRPYKRSLPHKEVVEMIKAESGKHFDPRIVAFFLESHLVFQKIYDDSVATKIIEVYDEKMEQVYIP